jgi:hypothetical protein
MVRSAPAAIREGSMRQASSLEPKRNTTMETKKQAARKR